MSVLEEAYRKGVAKGRAAAAMQEVSVEWVQSMMQWMYSSYPRLEGVDVRAEILQLDRERMDNPPDYVKFPEARGWGDRLRRERAGFLEGAGCDDLALAFYYNRGFFSSRRLNTRYAGSSPENLRAGHCTAVFIRDSAEGGPLFGRNLDDIRIGADLEAPFLAIPDARQACYEMTSGDSDRPWFLRDTVSSGVIGDEEPQEIFPLDAWDVMPTDCRSLPDMVEFLTRYTDFWGPCNAVLVDRERRPVMLEKANCRLGARYSENGVAAVTACSYLIPEMHAFKEACGRRVLAADAPDWTYWSGCDARYRRLLQLTEAANRRGAMLEDVGAIVTDHAVPFPDRICLAGETGHPAETQGNWTWTSKATVLTGPNRRTLLWRMAGQTAAYDNPPVLIPHDGFTDGEAAALRDLSAPAVAELSAA